MAAARRISDRRGPGGQAKPGVCARRWQRDPARSPRTHNHAGMAAVVRNARPNAGGDGSWHAFAVGQPVARRDGASSGGGRSTAPETDQPQRQQERSGRRAHSGAGGGGDAGVAAPRAASQRGSANGFDGDPVAGATGRSADQAMAQPARFVQVYSRRHSAIVCRGGSHANHCASGAIF